MVPHNERTQTWQQLVKQIRQEYSQLEGQEKSWIASVCARIVRLQDQLDRFYKKGDGLQLCRDCRGDCCAKGHNHLTLANLLLLLSQNVDLPELDYSLTCPLLGPNGCALPAGQRPYNCISFLCDRIEEQLQPADVEAFYLAEGELRGLYLTFAKRYAGASMTGLLLAAGRLQGRPFLQRIDNP